MKKKICLIFLFLSVANYVVAEEKTEDENKENKTTVVPLQQAKGSQRSIIVIQPQDRAEDYIKAFETLKKDKPSTKIYFQLLSKKTISNILDITMLDKGTLLLFKTATTQGSKITIVPIEDIEEIGHQ